MHEMLVTVIVPVYNRADLLVASLESVYQQTYRPIELIIINDGSTDESEEVILDWKKKRYGESFIIKYFFQENKGAPAARNLGLAHASGEFIQFLDSDDRLLAQKIDSQVQVLEEHHADIAVCDFLIKDARGNILETHLNNANVWRKVAFDGSLSVFTPLFRKCLIEKKLAWNEDLTIRQDKDFLFKLLMMTKQVVYTPGYWCLYIHHSNSQISASYHKSNQEFFKRASGQVRFFKKNYRHIPPKNIPYLLVGVFVLLKKGTKKAMKHLLQRFSLIKQ